MGEIFGAAGQIAGSAIQANAVHEATQMQMEALQRQRDFVFQNLNPSTINEQSSAADVQRAMQTLALQGQLDPALLANRYQAENNILNQTAQLGQQATRVGDVATQEAVAGTPGAQEGKQQLVDEAIKQLKLGATLPPDVQNELMQAGLEQSGMVTQSGSGKGIGGQMLRTIIGQAGLKLQQQRQQNASNLLTSASNLEAQRQNILQGLFPRLQQTQLSTLQGTQSALQQSDQMAPNAGLSGSDVANIWLSRVGATNQLTQAQADAAARGAIGQGQAFSGLAGGLGSMGGYATPYISGWVNNAGRNSAADAASTDVFGGIIG